MNVLPIPVIVPVHLDIILTDILEKIFYNIFVFLSNPQNIHFISNTEKSILKLPKWLKILLGIHIRENIYINVSLNSKFGCF